MRPFPLVSLVFLLPLGAAAELPPLPPAARIASADNIVTGNVQSISVKDGPSTEVRRRGYIDHHYTAHVLVLKVEKGRLRPGQVVECSYWKSAKRPFGWVGPGGQYSLPPDGARLRFYLNRVGPLRYNVLTPNGWDSLQ